MSLVCGVRTRELKDGRKNWLQMRAIWSMTHKRPSEKRKYMTERNVEKLKRSSEINSEQSTPAFTWAPELCSPVCAYNNTTMH